MAHYALLDENNIVVDVIVGKDENEDGVNWEEFYGNHHNKTCKRTSYNTYGGLHPNGLAHAFRKNYAGIGYTYDESRDAFIPPKQYPSMILNETTCNWEYLIPKPTLTQEQIDNNNFYVWDEEQQNWDLIEP